MKRPFDRIVGPDGVWKIDDVNTSATGGAASGDVRGDAAAAGHGDRTLADMNEREEFVLRCLNAAANLYGVLSREEFVSLYNGYAKDHDAPVSDPLTLDELDRLLEFFLDSPDEESMSIQDIVDEPEVWFGTFATKKDEPFRIAYRSLVEPDLSNPPTLPKEVDRFVKEQMAIARERVLDVVASFHKLPLLVLPEDDFLVYEDPACAEETKESRAFEKFVKKEYGLKKDEAELDVMSIQSHLRVNGAKIVTALECVRDTCDWAPSDRDAFLRLVNAVSPLVSATRTWEGRGRTQQELSRMGACLRLEKEDIYDVFGLDDDSHRDKGAKRDEDDWDGEDDWDDEDDWDSDDGYDEDEMIYPEDIPYSVYNGPIDFKFVKDSDRREAKVATYEDVREVTQDFVRKFVMRELTQEERQKGAVRLGFIGEKDGLGSLDPTLDCVVGDFASMMDDQGGEPAIRRVQAKGDDFDEFDRRAASYYANYRYTWLEILAAKSGVGVKCRDLLTGEELFLMEKSLSQGEVKGMTVCAGIAPMEDVYMSVGVISPARLENPATILKIVLTHLGLPTETPVRLNAADQARFAAETIRRIHANGNYGFTFYG